MTELLPSKLLANSENWTKGSYSVDNHGDSVGLSDPSATSFCIVGACMRCGVFSDKLEQIIVARGFTSLENFNDHPSTTHEDVLSVLLEAGL